ncbi:MAG: UDP-N-acetylglucosamine 1-carboxyvinyltransferase [Limnochordaceae bacterium]|nr:UDP-N-acetylglucosamine 1-carboxyvinyltransferase [Limnochordaceae bacterium]
MRVAGRLIVEGGRPLTGRVYVSGAKNSAATLLPATTLTDEPCFLRHVPAISDTEVLLEILQELGFQTQARGQPEGPPGLGLEVDIRPPQQEVTPQVPYSLAKRLRASILFLGPLLARFRQARVALPGGCDIGSRPIDLHLKGLAAMGAEIQIEHGFVHGECQTLHGAEIYLDFPSVGATENIMMAACLAEGQTILHNPAKEPEIVDLATFLNSMGAQVRGAGTDTIRISGERNLHGAAHTVIPDRIEAGTWLLAAAATRGEVQVENVIAKHLEPVIAKMIETGALVEAREESIWVRGPERPRAVQVTTMPYPGFPTDLQPQFTAYLLRAVGTSVIHERVFENRFGHVDELKRLGASIKSDGRTAVVEGIVRLTGAPLVASDLRMGAALLIGALMAEGRSVLDGVEHLLRGYEQPVAKLAGLGAQVQLVETEGELPVPTSLA